MTILARTFHPGVLLADELAARGLRPSMIAPDLGIPSNRLTEIVRGNRDITMDTSFRLGVYFGQEPDYWYRMQVSHNISSFMREQAKKIRPAVKKPKAA